MEPALLKSLSWLTIREGKKLAQSNRLLRRGAGVWIQGVWYQVLAKLMPLLSHGCGWKNRGSERWSLVLEVTIANGMQIQFQFVRNCILHPTLKNRTEAMVTGTVGGEGPESNCPVLYTKAGIGGLQQSHTLSVWFYNFYCYLPPKGHVPPRAQEETAFLVTLIRNDLFKVIQWVTARGNWNPESQI